MGVEPSHEPSAGEGGPRAEPAQPTERTAGPPSGWRRAARQPSARCVRRWRTYLLAMLYDVAIIGGGASGALVAARLLRETSAPLHVALVDRTGAFARGVAYGT